jgi:D-3-phosphoglycerate dehydrogenase
MSQERIICTGPIEPISEEMLTPYGRLVVAPTDDEDTLVSLMDGATALIVRGDGIVNARIIAAGNQLKVIARSGVGYNNVDIAAATAHGIPVVYTPGVGARAVAEGAMALMLALCKRLTHWDQQLKEGNWQSRFTPVLGDLDNATLGIVGFGRIGRILGRMATPFDMRIIAYDPFIDAAEANVLGVTLVELDALLDEADFISLHAAATPQNQGLINRQRLARVGPGAYFINMARGDLVEDLDILYEALEDGRLVGVGLDVFAPEPPDVSHPLFSRHDVLTSPHVLGLTDRSRWGIFKAMAEGVVAVFNGQRPEAVVNPEVF